jgi:hypothetical protein
LRDSKPLAWLCLPHQVREPGGDDKLEGLRAGNRSADAGSAEIGCQEWPGIDLEGIVIRASLGASPEVELVWSYKENEVTVQEWLSMSKAVAPQLSGPARRRIRLGLDLHEGRQPAVTAMKNEINA